jgi:hypothetical protein
MFCGICGKPTKQRLRCKSCSKLAENNPMWKGYNVKYGSLHDWVRSKLLKTEFCQKCGQTHPYDLANISGQYKRDLTDWEWLCRKCHMESDGRMENFKKKPILSPEERKIRKKAYYLKNRDYFAQKFKDYYQNNKEKLLKKDKENYRKRKSLSEK